MRNGAAHAMNDDGDINTSKPKRSQQLTHDTLVGELIDDDGTVHDEDLPSLYDNEAELEWDCYGCTHWPLGDLNSILKM